MNRYEMSWCPDCQRWIPANKMNYFDGHRVCQWCLDSVSTPEIYVYDPNREKVCCIFCDSADVTKLTAQPEIFKCNACGEIFII